MLETITLAFIDKIRYDRTTVRYIIRNTQQYRGFALPTVLIASTVMLLILATTLVSVTSGVAVTLSNRHYNTYAKEAAASGLAMAQSCLKANDYTPQWSDGSPLRPNTNCSGTVQGSVSPYVYNDGTLQTTYTIKAPINLANGVQRVVVEAQSNLVRTSTGQVWQTYNEASYATISAQSSFDSVTFGYAGNNGAFFGTIDPQGAVTALGYNGQGQLGNGTTTSATDPRPFILPNGKYAASLFTSFLSVGYNMFAITTTGELYGAGSNASGQLGNGATATTQATPVKYNLPAGVQARYVSILEDASFVIGSDNNVYASGNCARGKLGNNYTISGCSSRSTPVRVALPAVNGSDLNTLPVSSSDWVQSTNLAADRYNVILRMQGGRVYGWGANEFGQLGNNSNTDSSVPVQIGSFGNSGQPKAVQVAYDGESTWILDSNGEVWAAGQDDYGQLGVNTTLRTPNPWKCVDNNGNGTANGNKIQIYTCNSNSGAQDIYFESDNTIRFQINSTTVKCLDNSGGNSNNGNPIHLWDCDSSNPNQKWIWRDDQNIVNPATGKCLDNPGNGRTDGTQLQLYDCNPGDAQNWALIHVSNLKKVHLPSGQGTVKRITTDQYTTLFLMSNGTIWGAGRNELGQLGFGSANVYNPYLRKMALPAGRTAVDFYTTSTGATWASWYSANTYAILDDGSVWGVGSNNYGQLGNGTTSAYEVSPKKMNLPTGVSAKSVQSGLGTTVVLTDDGKIYTVGNNTNGQLGDGTTTSSSTPLARKYVNTRPLILY